MRTSILISLVLASSLGGSTAPESTTVTWNGWLSDKGCAETRVKADVVTPNGTICVKKCLDEGATPVFVNPQTRTLYELKDHPTFKDDVGFYLEVTGEVDERARTIAVRSVKRLGDVIQMCARPAKKKSS